MIYVTQICITITLKYRIRNINVICKMKWQQHVNKENPDLLYTLDAAYYDHIEPVSFR